MPTLDRCIRSPQQLTCHSNDQFLLNQPKGLSEKVGYFRLKSYSFSNIVPFSCNVWHDRTSFGVGSGTLQARLDHSVL